MTAISNNNIAEAIYSAIKDKNEGEQSLFFQKVTQFLFKKRLLNKVPDILLRLDKIINKNEGRIVVKVSSKERLSEELKNEIIRNLSRRYSVKEVGLVQNLDEKLLGGFKLEIDDEVIDLTIKNKIGKLQEYLIRPV